ncbi:MAG: hypothetical protein BGO78_13780 [Chloroflexi bacterium 44-23]|nr:MAG: hypothetical protein BGO78_13780 [Chloroflexi bacterium 44-23]
MEKKNKNLVWGFILILFGVFLLISEVIPGLRNLVGWPWIIMGAGALFLIFALFTRTGGLAIPGAIVGGIGAILFYQNLTGNWESWSYIWALIPGFVGIGILLASLISPQEFKDGLSASLFLIALSMVMFIVFGGNRIFGLRLEFIWPVVIILIGSYLLIRAFIKK